MKFVTTNKYIRLIGKSYADVFFIRDYRIGLLICITTFIAPNIGISGIVGILSLLIFDQYFLKNSSIFKERFLIYNSLLVSCGLGYIFQFNFLSLLLIILVSLITYFFSISIQKILYKYSLPVLSLPFCIVMTVIFMVSKNYSAMIFSQKIFYLFSLNIVSHDLVNSFFHNIGGILFLSSNFAGFIIFILLLYNSRFISLSFLVGHLIGIYFLKKMTYVAWSIDSSHFLFNSMLVSAGVLTIYFRPGGKNILILPLSLLLTQILNDFFYIFLYQYGVPPLTWSFNISSLLIISALRSLNFSNLPLYVGDTPESTWQINEMAVKRNLHLINLSLPLKGKLLIYQGFNGPWTHIGKWKYALDFIHVDEKNEQFTGSGSNLEDYYTYSSKVYAPVSGSIQKIKMSVPDNNIGVENQKDNWGNFILIKTEYSYYCLLSHLQQYSSTLQERDYVHEGDLIALTGNSGQSRVPHLHMHVQYSPYIGDQTYPFTVNYIQKNKIHIFKTPHFNTSVYDLPSTIKLNFFHFPIGEKIVFDNNTELQLCLHETTAEFFLLDRKNNKLYFKKTATLVIFYRYTGSKESLLSFIFATIPTLSLRYYPELKWSSSILRQHSPSLFKTVKSTLSFLSEREVSFSSFYLGKKVEGSVLFDEKGIPCEFKSNIKNIKRFSR